MSNETNLNAAQNNHIFTGKGRKMNKRISFVLATALVVNLFGMVAPARAPEWWFTVPDVVGMTEAAARRAISYFPLSVDISYEYCDTVPYAQVISQDPPGGTLVRWPSSTRVDLVIGGPQMVDVPDLVGMSEGAADQAIINAGLDGHVSHGFSETVPYGDVISQDPAGGTSVCIGAWVRLRICEKYQVPNVVGMTEADAKGALASDYPGFRYDKSWEHSYTVPEGCVISQDPEAGMWAGWYSTVNLVISRGPCPIVPDVVGMSESDAVSAINSAGYNVGYRLGYIDTVPRGYVICQSPAGGTRLARGSLVKFIGSLGPCPSYVHHFMVVPDVVGMTEAAAKSTIHSWGLSVGWRNISYEYSDTVPAGCVISQYPAGGMKIRTSYGFGVSVDLVISRGPRPDWIPAVVGRSESDAASVINSAGLSVGTIGYLYSDTVPAGCVISLYPRAGTVLDAGTEVDLDISMGPQPRDVPPIPVPPDASCLLAHWKLDEIEGAIAYDSSGNGNHGMVYGNPIWQPTGGIIDGTLEFDGDGDYVEIPKIGDSVEFTYAMWVAQNQVGSGLIALIDHKDWVYGSVQFELRDGHPKVGINGAITPAGDLDAWGHTLAAGEWHHVALAKSATELLMYVDGEEAARSELIMSDTVILGDGCIGAWVNPTWGQTGEQTRYFDGWVDDVRIYDCALDENQIKALISALPSPVLSEALDTALSFTTGGSADWFSQTTKSYYDEDAAQSGDIQSYQESWMQTTVSGKGTVSFYWKVSSERYCDFLEFYIDGSLQEKISGSVDWQQMVYTLPSGSHVLEWRYVKDYVVNSGSDCGWVDKVEWVTN